MLPRAARRKSPFKYLDHELGNLRLPWLCPALYRSRSHAARSQCSALLPAVQNQDGVPNGTRQPSKRLASAATSVHVSDDPYVPFPFQSTPQEGSRATKPLTNGPSLFSSDFIILDKDGAGLPWVSLRRKFGPGREVGGDQYEIYSTFDACLHVRRYKRAKSLAHRMAELLPENSSELRTIFNRYLSTLVSDMIRDRKYENLDPVNTWIEVDMKKVGLDPDATTYALMIKAAIHSIAGSKRDRTIRRYWSIVKQRNEESEVASLQSILSDEDLGLISQICPMDAVEIEALLSEDPDGSPSQAEVSPSTEEDLTAHPSTTTPEDTYIRETSQKGEGMKALKKALSIFSDNSHLDRDSFEASDPDIGDKDTQYQVARQSRLESDALQSAIERWRKENEQLQKVGVGLDGQLKSLGAKLWEWQQSLSRRLKEELVLCEAAEQNKGMSQSAADKKRWEYGPFLALINPDQLAALTILTALQHVSRLGISASVKMTPFVLQISRAVEEEAAAARLSKTLKDDMRYSRKTASKMLQRLPKLGRGQRLGQRPFLGGKIDGMSHLPWPDTIHAHVGAVICSHLFEAAKIKVFKEDPKTGKKLSNIQPVFTRHSRYEHGMRKHFVTLHPAIDAKLRSEPPNDLIAKHVPMVAKPRRWSSFDVGGYLTSPSGFLRIKNNEVAQRRYAEAAMERGDLDGYFAGLNVLGETGWRINPDVFEVMRTAWNSGEAVANLAPEDPPVEMPARPVSDDQLSLRKWAKAIERAENVKKGYHSNRCFQNFQMEIAKAFLNETFYLPHNIDFRGRAYPIPPYLHQMGADNCRGLLLFAEGRELGEAGLRWLKIHLANTYGLDKARLSDRESFAMEHIDEIIDSTDNPLDGRRWWLKGDDPWQCLATAFELRKALSSPDPTKYISHLPVHQDGSCNGLQHYAALGGDLAGAQQVNLEPGDRPSDVYTGVSELVKAEVTQDAANGNENALKLQGKITRKIVKQTVMTNVYGVTFMGAIRQVRGRLEELYPELETQHITTKLAVYIAEKIFRALGTLFAGAHDIQYWLGDCATRINTSLTPEQLDAMAAKYEAEQATKDQALEGAYRNPKEMPLVVGSRKISAKAAAKLKSPAFRCSVTWTTPLKLPVIQPYRDAKSKRVITHMQSMAIASPSFHDGIHRRKQLQAFPPNFIHSLDATHMMLSAIKCREKGLTFSAVHDSFWTHAADIDQMNEILRDEFVRMHSENIIGRLAAEFSARYHGNLYQAAVRATTEVGKNIRRWRRRIAFELGFSVKSLEMKRHEVLLEHKRQRLLTSSDPEEQRQGKEMVTGASIFEADDNGGESLYVVNSLGETAIGHVPKVTSPQAMEEALAEDRGTGDVDLSTTLLPHTTEDDVENDDELEPPSKEAVIEATNAMERRESRKTKKRQQSGKACVPVWLPIRFPPIPKRGEWDISRTRHSTYFFS